MLPFGRADFTLVGGRSTEKKKETCGGGGGVGGDSVPWPNPLIFYNYTILDRKGTPFIYFLYPLFIYLFFCHTKCKKRERKNTLQNKSGEEALNRNHKAYM